MRKPLRIAITFAGLLMFSSQAFALYMVVLKNGTRYRAKERWTISNGKALITLDTGEILQIDPTLIDMAKTEENNRLGIGDVKILGTGVAQTTQKDPEKETSTLGTIATAQKVMPKTTPKGTPVAPRNQTPAGGEIAVSNNGLSNTILSKFVSAYENVGLYDAKVTSRNADQVSVVVTTDNEDKVFGAISATAYLVVKLPEAADTKITMVELFMQTINGGAAGRFQMTLADAQSIFEKQTTIPDYFVHKVIY